jgi:membrane-associated PAP2 superfamily phosphatase
MSRTGLFIALVLAISAGFVFAMMPELDLKLADLFFDHGKHSFTLGFNPWLVQLRDDSMRLVAALVVAAAVALVVKPLLPRTRLLPSGRAAIFLLASFALGPGLFVNGVLKEYWSRPRPIEVVQFGGDETFVPWWDPRGTCTHNCSFVAGEGSAAFWTLAPAALVPLPWRPVAVGAALTFAVTVGALRMAFGGHFMSDVIFAGIFVFFIVWFLHALIFRWSASTIAFEGIARTLGRRTGANRQIGIPGGEAEGGEA